MDEYVSKKKSRMRGRAFVGRKKKILHVEEEGAVYFLSVEGR